MRRFNGAYQLLEGLLFSRDAFLFFVYDSILWLHGAFVGGGTPCIGRNQAAFVNLQVLNGVDGIPGNQEVHIGCILFIVRITNRLPAHCRETVIQRQKTMRKLIPHVLLLFFGIDLFLWIVKVKINIVHAVHAQDVIERSFEGLFLYFQKLTG